MDLLRFFRRKPVSHREPLVRRVRELELLSARLIRSGFAGDYHSAFHGRGIEFAQVREYQPGDDIRTIDWNVTARSGVPHVKQFMEERDLTILIAVDVSGSMSFGSVDWRKSDIAAELTSVFAFSAVQNSDRVGLLLFDHRVRKYIPPRRGRAHAQVIVRAAVAAAMGIQHAVNPSVARDPGEGGRSARGMSQTPPDAQVARYARDDRGAHTTDFSPVTRYLERVSAKRAVVILLSDFLDADFEHPLRRLNRKHDVIAIAISDPREERFPARGLARLVDAESGVARSIDLRKAAIGSRARQHHQQLERAFRSSGVDWLPVSTALPYDRELLRFFRERVLRVP